MTFAQRQLVTVTTADGQQTGGVVLTPDAAQPYVRLSSGVACCFPADRVQALHEPGAQADENPRA